MKEKNQKGITLIALIITIVVLLIIAGVAVSSLSGDNSVIHSSKDSVDKYNATSEHEKIGLAVQEYYLKKQENDVITLQDVMEEKEWCSEVTHNDVYKFTQITMDNNNKYTITSEGKILEGYFDFIANTSDELKEAINSAEDGNVIGVNGELQLTGTFGDNSGKTVVIAGLNKTSSLYTEDTTIGGITVNFKDLIMTGSGGTYKGIYTNGNFVKFSNCTFDYTYFLIQASEYEFENCTFNQAIEGNYNIWTYSADTVTFNNCTFNCGGRSVLIYADGGTPCTVNLNNCKFYASVLASGKAAIEIDSSYKDFIVNINNCTSTGFDKGSKSGNELWNQKSGTRATIYVDGELVN